MNTEVKTQYSLLGFTFIMIMITFAATIVGIWHGQNPLEDCSWWIIIGMFVSVFFHELFRLRAMLKDEKAEKPLVVSDKQFQPIQLNHLPEQWCVYNRGFKEFQPVLDYLNAKNRYALTGNAYGFYYGERIENGRITFFCSKNKHDAIVLSIEEFNHLKSKTK